MWHPAFEKPCRVQTADHYAILRIGRDASWIDDDVELLNLHARLARAGSRHVPGPQSGEARMRKVVTQGGFPQFRRATETPFNIVYEAQP